MAATLQDATGGRLVLGIGIGGHPAEHGAYGIPFPTRAERAARLEEAVAVMRALWAGRPGDAAEPVLPARATPTPSRCRCPPPPIIVGAESRRAWSWPPASATAGRRRPRRSRSACRPTSRRCAASGRARSGQRVFAAFDLPRSASLAGSPWVEDPAGAAAAWSAAGADGVVLAANTTADVDLLVAAADRR